jgi:hypothetical protein
MSVDDRMRALFLSTLMACAAAQAQPPSEPPAPDLRTARSALESYWRLKQWFRDRNDWEYPAAKTDRAYKEFMMSLAGVTAGSVHVHYAQAKPHLREVFSRTVKAESQESPTRVVIIANVRNVTPPPPGVVPTAFQLAERNRGRDYKYVIEKFGDQWKIAEIWDLPSGDLLPPTMR